MAEPQHIDAAILDALRRYATSGAATYVVRNCLRSPSVAGLNLTTAQVRRRLMLLERAGRVERVTSNYLVMIVWRVKEGQGT